MPISLTDDEFTAVLVAAGPIAPDRRPDFFRQVAEALRGCRIVGPGAVHRAVREAQRTHFDPPLRSDTAPRPGRKVMARG